MDIEIFLMRISRNITFQKIREVLENDPWAEFIVGDCKGADKYAMDYIYNKTGRKLTIYHMFESLEIFQKDMNLQLVLKRF